MSTPPSVGADPTTTSTAPIARAPGFAASFPIAESQEPSAFGSALLAPQNNRGLLLFATAQAALGERYAPAIYESPDGVAWTRVDDSALASGAMSFVNSAAWVGKSLAVGGSYNDQTGSHAALWLAADGRTFAPPEDVFGGATGFVNAVTAGPEGVIVAGRVDAADSTQAVAARRGPNGRWSTTELPGNFARISGMTSNGSTIVVSGSSRPVSIPQATVWVSTDGGATFKVANTDAIASPAGTDLGDVTTWSSGFVASACVTGRDGPTVALATSTDGRSLADDADHRDG